MDITKIQDEKAKDDIGVEVPIIGRDQQPSLASDGSQVVFIVLGRDAEAVSKVLEEQSQRLARNFRKTMTPKDIAANRREIAEAALVGWRGVEDAKGTPVPLTKETARQVLADRHYLEQVEEGIYAHARFFKDALER